jgi:hypothetical protein
MNSIGKECNELKAKYDECFHVWFSEKFLKGDTNDDMCKPIFAVYRDCVRVSIHKIYIIIHYSLIATLRDLMEKFDQKN